MKEKIFVAVLCFALVGVGWRANTIWRESQKPTKVSCETVGEAPNVMLVLLRYDDGGSETACYELKKKSLASL